MDNGVETQSQYERPPKLTDFPESSGPQKPPKKKTGLAGVVALILAVMFKFKAVILIVLGKMKFLLIILKLGKFASTTISMVVTIAIYAWTFGWMFAIGFVALLFAHEIGHYAVAKSIGLPVSGPVFIPFIGAFIGLKEPPKDAKMDAQIGYGGPLAGSLVAGLILLIYFATGSRLFLALAYTGFLLNLFNLIPVHPLDGGRVTSAISPYLWLIGIPILIYLTVISFNPILVLIIILGCVQLYKLWKGTEKDRFIIPAETRNLFAVLYFGLLGALGGGVYYTLQILGTSRIH